VAWAPFFSGAERALVRTIESLDPSRYRAVVALGTDAELANELRHRGVRVEIVPVVYAEWRRVAPWAASIARLVRLARREGAAAIHANDVPSFQAAGYAARCLGVPAWSHVRFPDSSAGFHWFLKSGCSKALFVSDDLRRSAIAEAPDLFDQTSEVVYDGLSIPVEATADDCARIRRDLGLPSDRFAVGLIGQVAEVKGIWDFIEAVRTLSDRGVRLACGVIGDDLKTKGSVRVAAEQASRDKGLAGVIKFLGFRPDADRLVPAFDVIAVPSHIEPLGNATLEAMAWARPVVGSRVGGIPEMVIDGATGLLVPSQDPGRLADAIESLVVDPNRARAMGLAGRARATELFDLSVHARRIQGVYDQALSAGLRGVIDRQRVAS